MSKDKYLCIFSHQMEDTCALDIFNEVVQYKLFTNSLLFTAPTFTFRLSFMKFYLVL